MKKDQIFILKDRGVLLISGQDSKDFLQNLVTNDINKVTETQSCFSSLLTPQGKYLFDFMIVKHKDGYFIDCELNQINGLINRLNVYKLNSKIDNFKNAIEENNNTYESLIDKTTKSLEKIIEKTENISKVQ